MCDVDFSRAFDRRCLRVPKPLFELQNGNGGVSRGFLFVGVSSVSEIGSTYLNVSQFGDSVPGESNPTPICSALDTEGLSDGFEVFLKQSARVLAVSCFMGASSPVSAATFEVQTAPSLLATFHFTGLDPNNISRSMQEVLQGVIASALEVNIKTIQLWYGSQSGRVRALLETGTLSQQVLARSQREAELLYDMASAVLEDRASRTLSEDTEWMSSSLVRIELSILDSERQYPPPTSTPLSSHVSTSPPPFTTSPPSASVTTSPSPDSQPDWILLLLVAIAGLACIAVAALVFLACMKRNTHRQNAPNAPSRQEPPPVPVARHPEPRETEPQPADPPAREPNTAPNPDSSANMLEARLAALVEKKLAEIQTMWYTEKVEKRAAIEAAIQLQETVKEEMVTEIVMDLRSEQKVVDEDYPQIDDNANHDDGRGDGEGQDQETVTVTEIVGTIVEAIVEE
eukprot:3504460-Rhodomonas_salina.1